MTSSNLAERALFLTQATAGSRVFSNDLVLAHILSFINDKPNVLSLAVSNKQGFAITAPQLYRCIEEDVLMSVMSAGPSLQRLTMYSRAVRKVIIDQPIHPINLPIKQIKERFPNVKQIVFKALLDQTVRAPNPNGGVIADAEEVDEEDNGPDSPEPSYIIATITLQGNDEPILYLKWNLGLYQKTWIAISRRSFGVCGSNAPFVLEHLRLKPGYANCRVLFAFIGTKHNGCSSVFWWARSARIDSGSDPRLLRNWSKDKAELELAWSALTASMRNIETIHLMSTVATSATLRSLARCPNLRSLYLLPGVETSSRLPCISVLTDTSSKAQLRIVHISFRPGPEWTSLPQPVTEESSASDSHAAKEILLRSNASTGAIEHIELEIEDEGEDLSAEAGVAWLGSVMAAWRFLSRQDQAVGWRRIEVVQEDDPDDTLAEGAAAATEGDVGEPVPAGQMVDLTEQDEQEEEDDEMDCSSVTAVVGKGSRE